MFAVLCDGPPDLAVVSKRGGAHCARTPVGSIPNTYVTNVRRKDSTQQTLADMLKHVCKGVWIRVLLVRKEIHRTRPPGKWLAGLIGTLQVER